MKFNELCDFVLITEAGKDYLSGKDKVYSLSNDAETIVQGLDLEDVKTLIKKCTLPFTPKYLISLVVEDLMDYMPAETTDLLTMLKRNLWSEFDESEKKSARAANVLFAFLKKKKIVVPGIPKQSEDDEIENLAKDLEGEFKTSTEKDDELGGGLSVSDIEKYGGSIEKSGPSEDESIWY